MGIGFIILFWLVSGTLLAVATSLVIWHLIRSMVRSAEPCHRRLLLRGVALPFACLAWAAVVFAAYALINVSIFHRDIGIGDGFDCPLPNGYALEFIDVLDSATLFKAGESQLSIQNVTHLQLTASHMLGSTDSGGGTSWFILDYRTGHRSEFRLPDEFEAAARARGFTPSLAPVAEAYRTYRYTWFDALAAVLLIVPPLIAGALFIRSISHIRNCIIADR